MTIFLKESHRSSYNIVKFLYIFLLFVAILIMYSEKDPLQKVNHISEEEEDYVTNMYMEVSLEDMVDSALATHQISCSTKSSVYLFFDSVTNMCVMVGIFMLSIFMI